MPAPGHSQDPEVIRQWMSQNLMNVSSGAPASQIPYPQLDPRLLGGSNAAPGGAHHGGQHGSGSGRR
jgi:hypothetical protein